MFSITIYFKQVTHHSQNGISNLNFSGIIIYLDIINCHILLFPSVLIWVKIRCVANVKPQRGRPAKCPLRYYEARLSVRSFTLASRASRSLEEAAPWRMGS